MNIASICVAAIVASILAIAIKRQNSEMSLIISICACIIILLAVLSNILSAIDFFSEILSKANISIDYVAVLLKVMGICFLTEFTADMCKDAGQSALSNNVALAGKVIVLIVAMPLFRDVLNIATGLLRGEV